MNIKGSTTSVVWPAHAIPDSLKTSVQASGVVELEHFVYPRDSTLRPLAEHHVSATFLACELRKRRVSLAPANKTHTNQGATSTYQATTKFSLIKDVTVNKFYDITVEVVKKFPGEYNACELYVSDYTTNSLLFNYPSPDEEDNEMNYTGDPFGFMAPAARREWPGPYGPMVLKVELHEPHASVARDKVKEGDFVFLQNVRIKMSNQNKLEANLWGDSRYPNKIQVHRILYDDHEEAQDIRKRKDQYWTRSKVHPASRKREGEQLTKAQKKKLVREQKKRAATDANRNDEVEPEKECHEMFSTNKHVRCMDRAETRPSSLSAIIETNKTHTDMGFINQNRRSLVRVIDFDPPRLEEFSQLVSTDGTQGWEWAFSLLVEDMNMLSDKTDMQRSNMWLHVAHSDAQFLLSLDAKK